MKLMSICRIMIATDDDSVEIHPAQLSQLAEIHAELDSLHSSTLGSTSLLEISTDTGNAKPFQFFSYRIPVTLVSQIQKEIDSLLALGVMEPSVSPHHSCEKSRHNSGLYQFHRLNSVTAPDPYLMPRIDDLSKLDLPKGSHQVPIKQEDRQKTAFVTLWGNYQCQYMAFGLRNGPSVFQCWTDLVLICEKWP